MNKKKKRSIFYPVYFLLIAVFLIALHIGLRYVRVILADYETAQPQYEAERVFQTYYADGSFDRLVNAAASVPLTPYEDKDAVAAYLRTYTTGKDISYSSISTGLDDVRKYIVKADDVKFSAFTIRPGEKKTEKGFALYELDTIELYCAGQESVRITVPKGDSVYVNGRLLGDEALTGDRTEHESCAHMSPGVEGIVFVTYAADGLYLPPASVEVREPGGTEVPLTQDADGSYSAPIVYSESLRAEYSEYVVAAAQALAAYMQNDAGFYRAAAYIDPNSELYENTRLTETYFVIDHSSYEFQDVETSEFYAYDPDTFSCRVTMIHVLHRIGSADYRDYIDTTFYLRRVGEQYLMYDRLNH